MKLSMPPDEFERLSNEAKKRHVVQLLIDEARANPVESPSPPIAFVMAGVPGAGKTEFLDSLIETLKANNQLGEFVRIDLDQIVTIYPDYTPKTYAKFRSRANNIIARCIDVMRRQTYNMMIDGTFSGTSGSSVRNVEKLLDSGYIVLMVYMYDDPKTAWYYTQVREAETDRGIDKAGFIDSCVNITSNLQEAIKKFRGNPHFSLTVVKQKVLRDKNYDFLSDNDDVDNIINQGYNIDNLKKTL